MQLLNFRLFSSWFSPLGASISSVMIWKSSRRFSRSLRVSLLTFDISVNCSIWVNFACFMKLWLCILKWLDARIVFGLLTPFLWLFSLKLKWVADFPTYWILRNMHSFKKITYWLLQVSLWNILNVLFVCWLVNVCLFNTCVQYSDGLVELQDIEFPFSLLRFFLKTFACLTVWPPIISWRFLLRLNIPVSIHNFKNVRKCSVIRYW